MRSVTRTGSLERLIDHAALFPPASMPLGEALEEDRAARASEAAALIGRFVVPADKLADLPPGDTPLSVVLSSPGDAGLATGPAVQAVELALASPQRAGVLHSTRAPRRRAAPHG